MDTKFRFTKKGIEDTPIPEKRCRIMDTGVSGLILDLYPSGTKTFRVYKKIKGQKSPVTVTLGKYPSISIELARNQAIEAIQKIGIGSNPNEEARAELKSSVTLQNVYDDYLGSRQLSPATMRGYKTVMDNYLKEFKTKPLLSITEDVVKKEHSRLTLDSRAQADLTMRLLRALFNYAKYEYRGVDNSFIFEQNPVQILSHLRLWNKVERRNTRISVGQLPIWFKGLEIVRNKNEPYWSTVCDISEFALLTGLRRSELLELKWSQINFEEKTYFFLKTKNGDPLELPITDHCLKILRRRELLKDEYDYVFNADNIHGAVREPKKAIIKIREASKIEFTLHDLRRTFASTAESLNIGSYMIKRLLNHRTRRDDVTSGYIILTPEELRKPAQQIEDKLLEQAGLRLKFTNPNKELNIEVLLASLTNEQKTQLLQLAAKGQ